MAAVGCPKMMSSLLFYHKKEKPLTLAIENEGRCGLKRFCSERPGGAAATSESREPVKLCPATSSEGERSRSRDGGRGCEPPLPPFFLWGELFLLLLVRGEGKYEGAGAPHCAPGRTIQHTAPRAAVPKYSIVYASASRSAMHTPVDVTGVEPALYLVCKTLACRLSAHTLRFFSGWGI